MSADRNQNFFFGCKQPLQRDHFCHSSRRQKRSRPDPLSLTGVLETITGLPRVLADIAASYFVLYGLTAYGSPCGIDGDPLQYIDVVSLDPRTRIRASVLGDSWQIQSDGSRLVIACFDNDDDAAFAERVCGYVTHWWSECTPTMPTKTATATATKTKTTMARNNGEPSVIRVFPHQTRAQTRLDCAIEEDCGIDLTDYRANVFESDIVCGTIRNCCINCAEEENVAGWCFLCGTLLPAEPDGNEGMRFALGVQERELFGSETVMPEQTIEVCGDCHTLYQFKGSCVSRNDDDDDAEPDRAWNLSVLRTLSIEYGRHLE